MKRLPNLKLADLNNEVKFVEHTWITLADGIRLSARIWLPSDADRNPVPAKACVAAYSNL